jgi:hypothetical protein
MGRVKPLLRRSKKISIRLTCQGCKRSSMDCLGGLRKFKWTNGKKKNHAEPTW